MVWHALQPFADWLGQTPLSLWLGESTNRIAWLFIFHLFGLTVFLGTTILQSGRLLGVAMMRQPASQLFRELSAWNVGGLALMLVSGGLIFTGGATTYFAGEMFRMKMAFLFVGLVFRFSVFRSVMRAEEGRVAPWFCRLTGLVSLGLWLAVAVSGRAIAFFD